MKVTIVCDRNECRAEDANGRTLAMIPLHPIRRIVNDKLSNRVGWSPSFVKRRLNAITKQVAKVHLLKEIKRIAKNPYVQKGLTIASTVYPPLGVSLAAVKAISNTVEAARRGDYSAQKTLAQLKIAAQQGDPRAIASFNAAVKVYQLGKQMPGVSGETLMRKLVSGPRKIYNVLSPGPKAVFHSAYDAGRSMLLNFASGLPF